MQPTVDLHGVYMHTGGRGAGRCLLAQPASSPATAAGQRLPFWCTERRISRFPGSRRGGNSRRYALPSYFQLFWKDCLFYIR